MFANFCVFWEAKVCAATTKCLADTCMIDILWLNDETTNLCQFRGTRIFDPRLKSRGRGVEATSGLYSVPPLRRSANAIYSLIFASMTSANSS